MSGLRCGFTTGTCAAAAAKAAALVLAGNPAPAEVDVSLPDQTRVTLPIVSATRLSDTSAQARVRKDAGDDPDITHTKEIVVTLEHHANGEVVFAAGDGVGTVTRPGLSVPPGEPAINPVPRGMIAAAVREILTGGAHVTVSIPGGRELAEKTFNPRLGVVGGLSILGTTGRVRPFSHPALQASLKCAVDVAVASGLRRIVLVPGHIGERAAKANFRVAAEQVLEVSNEWGFVLDLVARAQAPSPLAGEGRRERSERGVRGAVECPAFDEILVVGHPGKLAKLAADQWDTHSSRSESAVPIVAGFARQALGREFPQTGTVEAFFAELAPEDLPKAADAVATKVCEAVARRMQTPSNSPLARERICVVLTDLSGRILGGSGDLRAWQ